MRFSRSAGRRKPARPFSLRVECLESKQLLSVDAVPNVVAIPTAAPATATATFVGSDTTSEGNWTSAYGADGYEVIGGTTSLPSYATVQTSGALSSTWASSTTDPRALLTSATSTSRVAAFLYNKSAFTVNVDLTDGQTHEISLYALDWNTYQRVEQIQVIDPSTGTVLDTRTISSFHDGEYLTWDVSGDVEFKLTDVAGTNVALSGLFFGGAPGSAPTPSPTPATAPYTPAEIREAYGFSQLSETGAGQTIAIIDAYDDPTIASDLAAFDAKFGLPAANLVKAEPEGTPAYNSGWAMEESLDVEWAHAIAPGATILLVEAQSASMANLMNAVSYAVQQGAKQVSMSWGGGEFSGESSYDSSFDQSGVTFLASSGDDGAGVIYPAASPYVTAVGGTSLTISTTGSRISETAWSGSGGGVSTQESRPAFQNGFETASGRGVPDVSYDADPNTGYYVYDTSSGSGGWYQVGGTSAGSPQWAGLVALVNQGRAAEGKASLGTGQPFGTNSVLYTLAGGTSYTNPNGDFYDITSGNTGNAATVGYDNATGLGSPVANKLVPDLIAS